MASGRNAGDPQTLVVRVMVLADSAEATIPSAAVIQKKIEPFGNVTRHQIEQYWKMPELYEIYFLLNTTAGSCEPFNQLVSALGDGWDRHFVDERQGWAVWISEMGSFCTPDARWANVEYFPGNSLSPG